MAVGVCGNDAFVFVSEIVYFPDTGRLTVKPDSNDAYQLAVFEAFVLGLAYQCAAGFTDDLAATGVAVVVGKLVGSFN